MKNKKQNKNMFHKTKKIWPILLLGLILLAFPVVVFAQTPGGLSIPDISSIKASFGTSLATQLQSLFTILSVILLTMQAILWPVLLLMGGLLTNDFLFSGGMQTMLLNVWSVVRDFVNVLFVLVILGVAIANIIGLDKQDFQIKSVLPKIIIGLILVNFSFFGAKVVIDFSNVLATSIIAVPSNSTLIGDQYNNLGVNQDFVSKFCNSAFATSSTLKNSGGKIPDKPDQQFCTSQTSQVAGQNGNVQSLKSTLTDYGKQFFSGLNSRNIAIIMATEMMQITQINNVDATAVTDSKSLTINTLFSIIFFIIYAVAFVALFIALLVRTVVLWITTALLPVAVLGKTFAPIGKRVEEGENAIMGNFLKAALLPVPISIVLAMGVIMITQLKQVSSTVISSTNSASLGAIIAGPTSLQDLLAGLATAAFIWIAVFQAIGKGQWSRAIEPIRSTVSKLASSTARMPFYAPIIPTSKGGAPTIGLANIPQIAGLTGPAGYIRQRQQAAIREFGGQAGIQANLESIEKTQSISEYHDYLGKVSAQYNQNLPQEQIEKLAQLIGSKQKSFNMVYKPFQNFLTLDSFLKALKAGAVTPVQFRAFVTAQGGKPETANPEAKSAHEASKTAQNMGMSNLSQSIETQATSAGKDANKLAKLAKKGEVDNIKSNVDSLARAINTGHLAGDSATKMQALVIEMINPNGKYKLNVDQAISDIDKALSNANVTDNNRNAIIQKLRSSLQAHPKGDNISHDLLGPITTTPPAAGGATPTP